MRFFLTTRFEQHTREVIREQLNAFRSHSTKGSQRTELPTREAKYAFQTQVEHGRVSCPASDETVQPFPRKWTNRRLFLTFSPSRGRRKNNRSRTYRQCGESGSRQCSIIHEVKQVPLRPPVGRLASKWKRIYAPRCVTRYISYTLKFSCA